MDLVLFIVFLGLSLILVIIGLFTREHTELSLIGFVFLFLLSMTIISQDIDYKIGYDKNINYSYSCLDVCDTQENQTLLTSSTETVRDQYATFTLGGTLSHSIGYWLAIASIIGFIAVILSLRTTRY